MMAPTVMGAPGHESDPRLNLRVWCNLESTPQKLSRGEAREFNSLTRTKGTGVAVPIHTAALGRFVTFHTVPPFPLCQPSLCGGAGAFSLRTK